MRKYPGMKRTGTKRTPKPKKEKEMPVMKDAIDKEDWERQEKGLKPRPKPKVEMPDPEAPAVEKYLKLKDIPIEDLVSFSEERRVVPNREGVKFIGFDVIIRLKDQPAISGWMSEKDVLQLQKLVPRR